MYRYLGLFTDEIRAAEAYDRASVEIKGLKAVTNFHISKYTDLLSEASAQHCLAIETVDVVGRQSSQKNYQVCWIHLNIC